MEGYQYLFDEKLVTVWSAPNYCYRNQNAASILTLKEDGSREMTMFEAAPENYSDPAILAKMTVRKSFRPSICFIKLFIGQACPSLLPIVSFMRLPG